MRPTPQFPLESHSSFDTNSRIDEIFIRLHYHSFMFLTEANLSSLRSYYGWMRELYKEALAAIYPFRRKKEEETEATEEKEEKKEDYETIYDNIITAGFLIQLGTLEPTKKYELYENDNEIKSIIEELGIEFTTRDLFKAAFEMLSEQELTLRLKLQTKQFFFRTGGRPFSMEELRRV